MALVLPWRSEKREAVSADFDRALTQQILRTELIRIKALIATAAGLGAVLCTVYIFEPEAISRVWMGHLKPSYLYSILVPFILFELWVHAMISRHIRLDHDVPVFRRYLGAFIRNLDADGGAGAAYRQHGLGAGARFCCAVHLFHLHHSFD